MSNLTDQTRDELLAAIRAQTALTDRLPVREAALALRDLAEAHSALTAEPLSAVVGEAPAVGEYRLSTR